MKRISVFALVMAASLPFSVGCATKKYVRNETAPTINKVNELDDLTAKNTRDIRDVDSRAQQGIQSVQAAATAADQKDVRRFAATRHQYRRGAHAARAPRPARGCGQCRGLALHRRRRMDHRTEHSGRRRPEHGVASRA